MKFGGSLRSADYHVEDDLWFNHEFDFHDGALPIITSPSALLFGTARSGGDQSLIAFFNFELQHAPGTPQDLFGRGCSAATLANPATLAACVGPAALNLSAPQSFNSGIPVDVLGGFNNPKWKGWGNYFGGYAQDTWKLSSRLTMDLGVRFDFDAEPSPNTNNFYASPRVGFAWDPFGDHKTVIRAGGGTYYAPIDVLIPSYGSLLDGTGNYINEVLGILSPKDPRVALLWQRAVGSGILPSGALTPAQFQALSTCLPNTLCGPTGIPGFDPAANGATVGYSVNPNYKNPYAVEGSLSIDRELVKNLSLELGYNMYHGVHLQMPLETAYQRINPGNPLCPTAACTDATGGPLYAPTSGQLQHTSYESIGSSIYHGMTASLTKRYSNHLSFQVNYTWSKTIDNAIDFASFDNWFRPSLLNTYRAVSVFDIPHTFVANAVWMTPFKAGSGNFLTRALADISLAPIVTVRSGLPFSIRTPSLVNKINGQALDNNFATPFGASRDNNRGAGYATTDLHFSKAIYFNRDRGVKMDFIAEGTNIFNRVNFNKVADEFDIGGFKSNVQLANGQTLNLFTGPYTGLHGVKPQFLSNVQTPLSYASADRPRNIQFGVRLAF